MSDPALLLMRCWSAQLPLMLATATMWIMHGARLGKLHEWLRDDHHGLWHWALGFALPALMPVVLALDLDLPPAGHFAVAVLSGLWAAALLLDLVQEWRRVPGAPYRFLMLMQFGIASLGAWAGWRHGFVAS